MSGQTDEPPFPPAPEPPPDLGPERVPAKKRQRTAAEAALPWLLGVLVVLLLASSGGLVTAWIVASMKAAPPPAAAGPPTLRPSPTIAPTPTGQQTPEPTGQPLHTPTAAPVITPEPQAFVHVVQRGETLLEIADMYGVDIADILVLNPEIVNINRIFRNQEILIPGDAIRPSPTP